MYVFYKYVRVSLWRLPIVQNTYVWYNIIKVKGKRPERKGVAEDEVPGMAEADQRAEKESFWSIQSQVQKESGYLLQQVTASKEQSQKPSLSLDPYYITRKTEKQGQSWETTGRADEVGESRTKNAYKSGSG